MNTLKLFLGVVLVSANLLARDFGLPWTDRFLCRYAEYRGEYPDRCMHYFGYEDYPGGNYYQNEVQEQGEDWYGYHYNPNDEFQRNDATND